MTNVTKLGWAARVGEKRTTGQIPHHKHLLQGTVCLSKKTQRHSLVHAAKQNTRVQLL